MKSLLSIVSFLALAAVAAAGPASRTDSEIFLQREGGNGFVLVDRATGVLRAGTLDAAGKIVWQHTVDTGIPDVADVAGGVPGKSGELVAVASPMSNRVALVEIDAAYPSLTRFPPAAVGPRAVSEVDTSGGLGLMVACSLNGSGADDSLEIWNSFSTTPSFLRYDDPFGAIPVLEPLYSAPGGARVAVFTREAGGNTETGICVDDSTMLRPLQTVPGTGWRFITNVHSPSGALLIVFYRPGTDMGYVVKADLPVGPSMSFAGPKPVGFPFQVRGLSPVAPDADLPDGFLATSSDGEHLAWCRVEEDGNLSLEKEFDGRRDGDFLGALHIRGKGFVRFDAAGHGSVSQIATAWGMGTGGWEITDQSIVPSPSAALGRLATLFYFSVEPFLDEEARLLAIEPLPDWTRKSAPPAPVPASVLKETFGGAAQGLGSATGVATHPIDGTNYVLTNQVGGGLSLAALEPGMGVFQPEFGIDPPSGSYSTTVTVVPNYNENRYRLYYRSAGLSGAWQLWPGSLMIAASGEYLFTLVDLGAPVAETSRILRRTYQIDAAGMNQADADHDGVPDYVEQANGLDPLGGADTDGDGVSDLEELFAGTDPANDASFPPDAGRTPVPQGDGIELVALPSSVGGDEAFDGEEVAAFDMAGALVGRAAVADIPPAILPGIGRGAWISSAVTAPESEWLVVSSGTFFQTDHGGTATDDGIEVRKMIPVPLQPPLSVAFTPTGVDLAADAAGWLAAAQTAFLNYAPVSERTDMVPDDTAVAVLVETMLHAAATDRGLFSPPLPLGDFTAFPDRVQDAVRMPIDRTLVSGLVSEGMDFHALLELANNGVNGTGAGPAAIRSTVSGIYQWHLDHFDSDRSLALPLDVLRTVFAGEALPENYDGAVSAGDLATAQTAAAEIVASWTSAMRPTGTWLVEIPAISPGAGVYPRESDAQNVELFDRHGERFLLEQDRSLVPGSQFTVTGFTDAPTASGNPGMEVTAVAAGLLPAASSRDADGNLLDDEWERFFFGATGQDPQSTPTGSAYTLIQHFLEGTDPRSNGADEPSVPPVAITMGRVDIQPTVSGDGFDLGFAFPGSYLDRFKFIVESSDTMGEGTFHEVPGTSTVEFPPGSDRGRITIQANPQIQPRRFYRVRPALP